MPQRQRISFISIKKRQKLVDLVLQNGFSISRAGKKLGIKPSTAKLIVKKYRQTGRFFMRMPKKSKISTKTTPVNQERPETHDPPQEFPVQVENFMPFDANPRTWWYIPQQYLTSQSAVSFYPYCYVSPFF